VPYPPGNTRNRCGRQLLMLSAALAVGVPGCLLSLTSCGAQAPAQAQGGGQPQADAQARLAPVTAQVQRSQTRKKSSQLAVALLTEAAQEGVQQTYQGQEIVTRTDSGGATVLVSTVYHKSGGPTFTLTQATGSQKFTSGDLDGQSPEGVLGVTAPLVQLLKTNYVLSYQGSAATSGRPAQLIEASRDDGSLAAEFWLDTATKLPLERVVYYDGSQVVSMGTFTDVKIGTTTAMPVFVSAPQPSATVTWSYPIAPPQLLAFAQQGWVVPSTLPGGLTLFTGGETNTSTGQVLDLSYSDGLYVVSVFEQHGRLATKLAGWQKTKVAGQVVYAAEPDQRSFTWSGRDVVYTVIADAPPQTVADVIGKLPHDEPPGFWKRISHGFARLAHIVNPFG
jgi:sigma-E factor negative regulatory protein RseB